MPTRFRNSGNTATALMPARWHVGEANGAAGGIRSGFAEATVAVKGNWIPEQRGERVRGDRDERVQANVYLRVHGVVAIL